MSLLKRINQSGNQPQPAGGGNASAAPPPTDDKSRMDALRRNVPLPAANQKEGFIDIKVRVQTKLLSELDPSIDTRSPEVRTTIRELFETILVEESILLTRSEKDKLFDAIIAEILG